jgi:hypothetical protein
VLSGTGWIATNGIAALTVEAGGIVDPGAVGASGRLTVTGNVHFAAGALLRVDLAETNADRLAVMGNVTGDANPSVVVRCDATATSPWKIIAASSIAPAFLVTTPGYALTKLNSDTELGLVPISRRGATMLVR